MVGRDILGRFIKGHLVPKKWKKKFKKASSRSYKEKFGERKVEELKNKSRKRMIGKNNPNYKNTFGSNQWFKKGIDKRRDKTEFKKGEKHWNWKGGITNLQPQIRNNIKYKKWRLKVYNRDNFICQNCWRKGSGNLEAHHIKPFGKILMENNIKTLKQALNCKELWDLDNGITYCIKCHKIQEKKRKATPLVGGLYNGI